MMMPLVTMALLGLALPSGPVPPAIQEEAAPAADPQAVEEGIRALDEAFVSAFDCGDAEGLAGLFAPEAEFIDEEGNVYHGREAIAGLLSAFFEQYPGATIARESAGIRPVGGALAIDEGVMTITSADRSTARNHYLAVLSRSGDGWRVASIRHAAEEPIPTPRDFLEPLAWLVGEWVSEGGEQEVALSCRWSDDGNFLLASYSVAVGGEVAMRTDQRIGWDGAHRVVRSWSFDSDGGFSEGRWSGDGSAWVVKSELVLPDGPTGSATFFLAPVSEDRFVWTSFDRVIDGAVQPDVEVVIVRKPPGPSAAAEGDAP